MVLPEFTIDTLDLFPEIDALLISCLRSCSTEDWYKPTLAGNWTVQDIAGHLLDTTLRSLSVSRDGFTGIGQPVVHSYADLVNYLNTLNADWVKAFRRVSPAILIHLLEASNKEYYEHALGLNLTAPAIYSVAWAGESVSSNRFHIAREYTEKWHHQQQIRTALGLEAPLMQAHLYLPCIGTFLHGLPYAYRNTIAADGTTVQITIIGDPGGNWLLERKEKEWSIHFADPYNLPTTQINLDPETAWKLFTKGISSEQAGSLIQVSGNNLLAEPIVNFLAVMA